MKNELTPEEQERLRRRDSLPVLPDTYDPMRRLIGDARTVKFVRAYGGREARFPAHPRPDHEMVRLIGLRAVQLLRHEYGALDIRWPSAANYLAMLDARAMRQRGEDITSIARKLYRDTGTIRRYVSGVRPVQEPLPLSPAAPHPDRALPLFDWRKGR